MNLIDKLNSQLNDRPDKEDKVLCDCTLYPEDHRVTKSTRYTHRNIYPHRSILSSQQSTVPPIQAMTSNDIIDGAQYIEEYDSGNMEDIWEMEERFNSPSFNSRFGDDKTEGLEDDAGGNYQSIGYSDDYGGYEDEEDEQDEENLSEEETIEDMFGEDMQFDDDDQWELECLKMLSSIISCMNSINE